MKKKKYIHFIASSVKYGNSIEKSFNYWIKKSDTWSTTNLKDWIFLLKKFFSTSISIMELALIFNLYGKSWHFKHRTLSFLQVIILALLLKLEYFKNIAFSFSYSFLILRIIFSCGLLFQRKWYKPIYKNSYFPFPFIKNMPSTGIEM